METYEITYTFDAKNDIKDIAAYIKNVLKSPLAAESTVRAITRAVSGLDFIPQRYAVLPEDFLEKAGVRRMQVRNYFIYFHVDEYQKQVNIIDVLYVGREQRDSFDPAEE